MACLPHKVLHIPPHRGLHPAQPYQSKSTGLPSCKASLLALQANDLAGRASVKFLKWASDVEGFNPPFNVIIASDLLYDMKAIPELMLTIVSLSSSDTVTYLAFELRPNVIRAAFQAMELYGLKAEQVRPWSETTHNNNTCILL